MQQECDRKLVAEDELEALRVRWLTSCGQSQIPDPVLAIGELNKRVQGAKQTAGKSKLNFASYRLTDAHVMTLVQAMAATPLISKLDLSGSNDIGVDSVGLLVKLLRGQTKLVCQVHMDERLQAG